MTIQTLSLQNPRAEIVLGATTLVYTLYPANGLVSFTCQPTSRLADRVAKRQVLQTPEVLNLPAQWQPMPASIPESLVQLHLRGVSGPSAFAQGRTLRNGEACALPKFERQTVAEGAADLTVTTSLACADFAVDHVVHWYRGEAGFRMWTVFHNRAKHELTLDMLASFSLSGLSPFDPADAPERLVAHRIRSAWSSEGRVESRLLEELQLERSWTGHAMMSERFGQVGSQPVRGFFPFVALEDTLAGVCWGAQLEIASSWQLEIYRRHDDACLSGGIADREFGHWWKTVAPGASFSTPKAAVATVAGDLDELCHCLTSLQERAAAQQPAIEANLPMVFNEWCTSWGKPTLDQIDDTAGRLGATATTYYVIDDGWAEKMGEGIQQNGDWNVNMTAFPGGLKVACDAIRSKGLIPGLWFEFEVCTEGTKAWLKTDHQLHRDGQVLRVGPRRFWDFRDPWTFEYLGEKVIKLLKDNGFGYLKVDYNETIGIGVDGPDSPGENLRQHVLGVQEFFREVRRQIPDIVIENCSSGGHRLEPSMMAICGMGSFSDAHETPDIPIIAANLHRVILPRQNQVWAVLRTGDSRQRLCYSLAATFLGRMAISGDLEQLGDEQMAILKQAQDFYQRIVPIIRQGQSRRFGTIGSSYRHPHGWQAVRRATADGRKLVLVIHSFADASKGDLVIPLPPGAWKLAASFNPPSRIDLSSGKIRLGQLPDFTGCALLLEC